MKITEIEWKNGNRYKTLSDECEYVVLGYELNSKTNQGRCISKTYMLKDLLELDFELVVDWSTVAVDTPVWVMQSNGIIKPMHFNYYCGDYIFVFGNGKTSHTFDSEIYYEVSRVSLTKPK